MKMNNKTQALTLCCRALYLSRSVFFCDMELEKQKPHRTAVKTKHFKDVRGSVNNEL